MAKPSASAATPTVPPRRRPPCTSLLPQTTGPWMSTGLLVSGLVSRGPCLLVAVGGGWAICPCSKASTRLGLTAVTLNTLDVPMSPYKVSLLPRTAQNKTFSVSGKTIRSIKRSKCLGTAANGCDASPAAHPTLDSGPQAPEAADERADRRNSSLLISAHSPDSCGKPAPDPTREDGPAIWMVGVGAPLAPSKCRAETRFSGFEDDS